MRPKIVFELCAETLDACLAARQGGADRIELSDALDVGGLTPPRALIREAIERSALPVHVLLRPRAGGFVYDEAAFSSICEEVEFARSAGASGIVVGVLHPDRSIDIDRTRALVDLAQPLEVTFHRAFDEAGDQEQALEDVIAAGCHRVLTSGGAPDVVTGAARLAWLVDRAGDRIAIAVGGGLRVRNARHVATRTRATHFHGSLPREGDAPACLADRISTIVRILREEQECLPN